VKKPSSLAQQVKQAQKIYGGWTDAQKASVRLQGSSRTLSRFAPQSIIAQRSQGNDKT